MLTFAKCGWVLTDMGPGLWGLVEGLLVPVAEVLGYKATYAVYKSPEGGAGGAGDGGGEGEAGGEDVEAVVGEVCADCWPADAEDAADEDPQPEQEYDLQLGEEVGQQEL
jgi:hypothetical protein